MSAINMDLTIRRLVELPGDQLVELVIESEQEGFRLVRRLVEDWNAGANRFDGPGEALFAATVGERIVGVCGLNRDPYTNDRGVGRVRHLYVLAAERRRGIGRRLVGEVMSAANSNFDRLRLGTNSSEAAAFYERLGFQPVIGSDHCTHVFDLRRLTTIPHRRDSYG